MHIIPFEELNTLCEQVENEYSSGYHLIYNEIKVKEAIDTYDSLGVLKYVLFAPRYHELIEKARKKINLDMLQ